MVETIKSATLNRLVVEPGKALRLKAHDPGWAPTAGLKGREKEDLKKGAQRIIERDLEQLAQAQTLLYASGEYSILVVLQAMDAAGKDGMIQHVMGGLNPQGCQVRSFKKPSAEELAHDFLWRCNKALPERGQIGIFNRSYYEDVLVLRVHPELLGSRRPDSRKRAREFWENRYQDISAFERHLTREGTVILKFFLNISRDEQKRRFLERLDNPQKHWKFSVADLAERAFWDDYMKAYEDAIEATSTKWAPWYIIPADHKWVARTLVAHIVTRAITDLKLKYPEMGPEQRALLAKAQELAREK